MTDEQKQNLRQFLEARIQFIVDPPGTKGCKGDFRLTEEWFADQLAQLKARAYCDCELVVNNIV